MYLTPNQKYKKLSSQISEEYKSLTDFIAN